MISIIAKNILKFLFQSILPAIVSFVIVCGCHAAAEASWLIDAARFHISVHGQNTCLDCHAGVAEKGLHPDPLDVNRKPGEFFSNEPCFDCHDQVRDEIDNGSHGGRMAKGQDDAGVCISCHDPHYQQAASGLPDKFDPSLPAGAQCGACHDPKTSLPASSGEESTCMACHGLSEKDDPGQGDRISEFCFHCHGGQGGERTSGVPLIDKSAYRATPHAGISCLTCHQRAIEFSHSDQVLKACSACHLPHDEKKAHDFHPGVSCMACHVDGAAPARDPESRMVVRQGKRIDGELSTVHHLIKTDNKISCRRCHAEGNSVGAAAMVLPPKSILCMPCHTATFSAGDAVTLLSLALFFLGIAGAASVWFSGRPGRGQQAGTGSYPDPLRHKRFKALSPGGVASILKIVFLELLLQRRLYRQSRVRWAVHSLIFFPFVIRFFWGLAGLTGSLLIPSWPMVWDLVNKNHQITAFLFDFTGMMVIVGVFLAMLRKFLNRNKAIPDLPGQDLTAIALLAAIIISGFILEGIRIGMTGVPFGSEYAFIGYGISRLLPAHVDLTQLFGYGWYAHALFTGAFVVYLPFSGMFHIIVAPIALILNGADR